MSEPSEPAKPGMPRADFITGLVFALLGVAVVWASLDMPRFAERNANPYTIPGLVPGAVGAIILVLGVVLFVRAALRRRLAPGRAAPERRTRMSAG